jgi:predicted transglutaminase-like cysteine proteinase
MRHPLIVRALLGSAGLAACIGLLSGVARAAEGAARIETPITVNGSVLAPNVFDTVALRVKPDRYMDDWERARRDDSTDPRMQSLIAPARAMSREGQIAYVQGAVYRAIRWRSDATEWGMHDYWASAAETLAHGAGDMEDRAIVKMQALRALGVPTRDLYLTMGRDAVGGPVTVLIVRVGPRFYVLDDTGGSPFTTDRRPEFSPMLTFGYGATWIHGHRVDNRGRLHVTPATASAAGLRGAH